MRTANRLPPYPLRKLLLLFLPPSAPRGCRVGDAMGFPSSAPSGRERRGERRRDLPAGSRTHPTGEPTCAAPRRAEPSEPSRSLASEPSFLGWPSAGSPPFRAPSHANAPPLAEKPPALPPSSRFDRFSSAPPWWEETEPSSARLGRAQLRACVNRHALANSSALKGAVRYTTALNGV